MRRLSTPAAALSAAILTCAVLALSASPAAAVSPPHLQVTGASLIVAGSDQPLYGEQQNARRAIASTTKLMTALVVLQHVHNLNTVYAQGPWQDQPDDSQIGLVPGERMSVRNLLLGMLIPSGDDAAEDLAYNVGGHSVARFLKMMNADARKLGLTGTHYTTPTGLDTPGNYSTAADLVRLGDYDMRHFAFLRRTVRTQTATIWNANHTQSFALFNTDTLLGTVPWIDGIKTGHTDDAGYVLVSQGTRHGLTLISSVLGTSSPQARNQNALSLLRWGFAHFHRVTPVRAGERFAQPKVQYESTAAKVIAAHAYSRVVPNGARVRLHARVPQQLTAPRRKGAVVGRLTVLVAGRAVARLPLVLARALPPVGAATKVAHFIGRPITLIGILLVVFGGVKQLREQRRPVGGRRKGMVQLGRVEER